MRILVTGSSGTIGQALAQALAAEDATLIPWRRDEVPIDDYAAMDAFVRASKPDALIHLAAASQPMGKQLSAAESWAVNYEWTSELAWLSRQHELPFVFTSTVMVFEDSEPGPYTIGSAPIAAHGYGMEKRRAEQRVFEQNPHARVVRLGWQIGGLQGNTMGAWLEARRDETISAALRWMPACAFLEDTCAQLLACVRRPPGLYQLDANEGWSFYDIARALRVRHDADWELQPSYEWAYDQRMLDPRCPMTPLAERLPELLAPA